MVAFGHYKLDKDHATVYRMATYRISGTILLTSLYVRRPEGRDTYCGKFLLWRDYNTDKLAPRVNV